jgi:hypothetical protein
MIIYLLAPSLSFSFFFSFLILKTSSGVSFLSFKTSSGVSFLLFWLLIYKIYQYVTLLSSSTHLFTLSSSSSMEESLKVDWRAGGMPLPDPSPTWVLAI